MLPTACLALAAVAAFADRTATVSNRAGTHTLVALDGEVRHSLDGSRLAAVNDETARWKGAGNRLSGVVAVAGSGFAGLDDVMVLAVDADGGVWATARLPTGVWLPWGSVSTEAKLTATAVGVSCSCAGRTLSVTVRHADGSETACVRRPNGEWGK